jgi:hypothetical protein
MEPNIGNMLDMRRTLLSPFAVDSVYRGRRW